MMKTASSTDAMVRNPVGRYVLPTENTLVWCESATLCGAIVWGAPTVDDVEKVLAVFDGYRSEHMAPSFRVILDGRNIEGIDPDGLALLFQWLTQHRVELSRRVELQIGVVARGSILGVTLSGILPTLGETHAFRVVSDPRSAFCELSERGDELFDEVEQAAAEARRLPYELRRLREELTTQPRNATLAGVSRVLKIAQRTLQRQLQQAGTTFRDELREARFLRAKELLVDGSDKISVVARRLGVSQGALTQLIREKSGHTPAELRRLLRAPTSSTRRLPAAFHPRREPRDRRAPT